MTVMSTIPFFRGSFGVAGREFISDEEIIRQLANEFFKSPPVPSPTSASAGTVPSSVAGSGISPSAVNQGNSVDLNNRRRVCPIRILRVRALCRRRSPEVALLRLLPLTKVRSGRNAGWSRRGSCRDPAFILSMRKTLSYPAGSHRQLMARFQPALRCQPDPPGLSPSFISNVNGHPLVLLELSWR